MDTIIRPASTSDTDAILKFIQSAYMNQGELLFKKILYRWPWQYRENPSIVSKNDELTILIATKGDEIVGQACMTPVKLKIGSQFHTASWGTDFIVSPVCRGEGIGKKLMQIEAEHSKFMIGIRATGVTRKIAEKIGYKTLDPVPFYRRIVRYDGFLFYQYMLKATKSRPVINRLVKTLWNKFWLDKLTATAMNSILGARNLLERQRKKEILTDIEEVQNFDERIDRLWDITNDQYDVIVKRDKEFLNWRYSPRSALNYRKFIAARNGEIKGYIVLRKEEPGERNFGIIVDLYASRDDRQTIEDLLRHAIRFFDRDVVAIECIFSIKEYQNALSKLGFIKMECTIPICYCQNSAVIDQLLAMRDKWFLTKGDHDMDQYTPFRTV
jgi:hypothetical protein